MPPTARRAPAGTVIHVLNRGVGRRTPFDNDGNDAAVERCLAYALAAVPGPDLPAYYLMPNHWHQRVRPETEDALGRFVHRLTMTHTRRRQGHRRAVGKGHRYQGRFKSFPVRDDGHCLTVARHVERNARRAGRVDVARPWPWGSLHRRTATAAMTTRPAAPGRVPLPRADGPVAWDGGSVDGRAWAALVDRPQADAGGGPPSGRRRTRACPAAGTGGDGRPARPGVGHPADGTAEEGGAGVRSAPVPLPVSRAGVHPQDEGSR